MGVVCVREASVAKVQKCVIIILNTKKIENEKKVFGTASSLGAPNYIEVQKAQTLLAFPPVTASSRLSFVSSHQFSHFQLIPRILPRRAPNSWRYFSSSDGL